MAHELRPYQAKIVADARESFRAGHRSILIVLPTGGGKTRVGAEFVLGAVAKNKKVLWLAHRKELIAQAHARLICDGVPRVGVISAQLPDLADADAAVQVASLQTLTARSMLPAADLVVFDEAHHYVASEWHSFAKKYESSTCLGLTATPQRTDKTGLGNLFTDLVEGPSIAELTKDGFLVPCKVIAPEKFLKNALAQTPADAWLAHGKPRSVVFCKSLEHSAEVLQQFIDAGARAADIDGGTPQTIRAARLAQFQTGELDVIVNVYVLTEGWDAPAAEACILARPTQSPSVYLQMVGRVLRPAPGKTRALLLDLPGVSWLPDIGLPDDVRQYSLEGEGMKRQNNTPFRQCLVCGGVSTKGGDSCDNCGAAWPVRDDAKPVVAGKDLFERDARDARGATPNQATARAYLNQLKLTAAARGYQKNWCAHQFKNRFGYWPWECGNVAGW